METIDDVLHERLRGPRDVDGGQIGEPQVEDPRRQREDAGVMRDAPQLLEGEQVAARGRARQARTVGDFGDRQRRGLGAERADHRKPALESLDELASGGLVGDAGQRSA